MELEEQKPKDIFLEIKQETEDILENVKKEPKEEENFELTVPKLEESLKPNTKMRNQQFRAKYPVRTYSIQTQKTFLRVDTKPQKRYIIDRRSHACSVCLKSYIFVKTVTREFDKLVIMTGCVLRGDYSLIDAQIFMSRKSNVRVCRKHFFDVINEIFKFLNIKHPAEITSCSVDSLREMMITVNTIIPQITTSQFCNVLNDFALINMTWKRNPSITEFRCSVCSLKQNIKTMVHVLMPQEKFVIMIGRILRGDDTLEQANRIIAKKKGLDICRSHLIETKNEIYYLLNIKKSEEILTCSSDLMENVMATVNEVSRRTTTSQFRDILKDFVTRNEMFFDTSA